MAAGAGRPLVSYQLIVGLEAPANISSVDVLAAFEGYLREQYDQGVVRIVKVRVASMVFKGTRDEADSERGG